MMDKDKYELGMAIRVRRVTGHHKCVDITTMIKPLSFPPSLFLRCLSPCFHLFGQPPIRSWSSLLSLFSLKILFLFTCRPLSHFAYFKQCQLDLLGLLTKN
jgi:hypothetical protein